VSIDKYILYNNGLPSGGLMAGKSRGLARDNLGELEKIVRERVHDYGSGYQSGNQFLKIVDTKILTNV